MARSKYHLVGYSYDCGEDDLLDANTLTEAKKLAKEYLEETYWNDPTSKYWAKITIWNEHTNTIEVIYDEFSPYPYGRKARYQNELEAERQVQFARNPQLSLF